MTDEKDFEPAPEGWTLRYYPDTFTGVSGPYYFRDDPEKPGVGFFSRPQHTNLGEIIHGGALLTLADMALFTIASPAMNGDYAVTVALNSEFLRPGPVGEFIEAAGEISRAGKSLIVVRGDISAKGKKLLTFSGTIMRVPQPAAKRG